MLPSETVSPAQNRPRTRTPYGELSAIRETTRIAGFPSSRLLSRRLIWPGQGPPQTNRPDPDCCSVLVVSGPARCGSIRRGGQASDRSRQKISNPGAVSGWFLAGGCRHPRGNWQPVCLGAAEFRHVAARSSCSPRVTVSSLAFA